MSRQQKFSRQTTQLRRGMLFSFTLPRRSVKGTSCVFVALLLLLVVSILHFALHWSNWPQFTTAVLDSSVKQADEHHGGQELREETATSRELKMGLSLAKELPVCAFVPISAPMDPQQQEIKPSSSFLHAARVIRRARDLALGTRANQRLPRQHGRKHGALFEWGSSHHRAVNGSFVDLNVWVVAQREDLFVVCRMVDDEVFSFWSPGERQQAPVRTRCLDLVAVSGAMEEGWSAKCRLLVLPVVPDKGGFDYGPQRAEFLRFLDVRGGMTEEVDVDVLDEYVPPLPSRIRPTIVTAFSENHFEVGMKMLLSIGVQTKAGGVGAPYLSVIVYTLGEMHGWTGPLECAAARLRGVGIDTDIRSFDFSAFPVWMRLNEGYSGGFGWKGAIVHQVLLERGMVLWLDAGNFVMGPEVLLRLFANLERQGFVGQDVGMYNARHVHDGMLQFLQVQDVDEVKKASVCSAATLGYTFKLYRQLIKPWFECTQVLQCVAPYGSNLDNHRQDQAVLNALVARGKLSCDGVGGFEQIMQHCDQEQCPMGILPKDIYCINGSSPL